MRIVKTATPAHRVATAENKKEYGLPLSNWEISVLLTALEEAFPQLLKASSSEDRVIVEKLRPIYKKIDDYRPPQTFKQSPTEHLQRSLVGLVTNGNGKTKT